MKKLLIILASISLLALSCQKAETGSDTMVSAGFSVRFDRNGQTKASVDHDGAAANVNRCILQIWLGEKIYKTIVKTDAAGTTEYKFENIPLVADQTYDFLFWADNANGENDKYYSTSSLRNVTLKDLTIGNEDALDAFCNQPEDSLSSSSKLIGQLVSSAFMKVVVLKRPLAQLNVITTDGAELNSLALVDELKPVTVSYSYKGCTGFNVRTNEYIGEPQTITINDKPVYNLDATGTLMMNYILPADGYEVTRVNLSCKSASGATVSGSWDNVPLKRNYRTNIRGSVLVKKGNFEVVIDPQWYQPDYEVTW